MMNTKDGYSKLTLDNTKVLLAGGGDKSLTDICSISNGIITINGTTIIPLTSLPLRLSEYITSNELSTSTYNGFGRVLSNSPFAYLHSSNGDCMTINTAYSSVWAGQLAADYRTNNIAYRAKNNGTWTDWALMKSNKNTFEFTINPAGSISYEEETKKFTKINTTNAWNSEVYSKSGYKECILTFKVGQADKAIMVGLNSDPSTDAGWSSLDYSWYLWNNGNLDIRESNTTYSSISGHTTYSAGDEFMIKFSNGSVRYYHNGTLCRTVSRSYGTLLYFDSSFHGVGGYIYDLNFEFLHENVYWNNPQLIINKSTLYPVILGDVIDTHGEGNRTIILDGTNDLYGFYSRNGTCTAYEVEQDATLTDVTLTPTETTVAILSSNVFNGVVGYNQTTVYSGNKFAVYDLVLPATYSYGCTFFWSFGASSWKPSKMRILTAKGTSDYVQKYSSNDTPTFGSAQIGSDSAGFNKLRIVVSKYSRLSTFGLKTYSTTGLNSTYMSRCISNSVYRSINPAITDTYSLGTSTNKWNDIYGTSIYGTDISATTFIFKNYSSGTTVQTLGGFDIASKDGKLRRYKSDMSTSYSILDSSDTKINGNTIYINGSTITPLTSAPVTSVNGQTGAVTINTGVTSFNGDTGAVTYTAPVTSVNGNTGAVTLTIPQTWVGTLSLYDAITSKDSDVFYFIIE